jgi:2-aminoethylphosphonate-pyruvate transaminase
VTRAARDRLILMNPGPVNADERVRAALGGPDLCHREPEFGALLSSVRTRLTCVSGGGPEHATVVLTGSGTAAVEAMITSVPPLGATVLAIDNGHYGRRMHDIAVAHAITTRHLEFGWGNRVDLTAVDEALAANPSITHVSVVHHETSTGMRNDVAAVARVAHGHGRQLLVDAVSSVGAEALESRETGLDWVAGSASKNIESMPGLSFVCSRHDRFLALAAVPARAFYLDLYRNYQAQEQAAPAFTPGVPAFYALDVALDLLLGEGVTARAKRYLALAELLRAGLIAAGLELLLPAADRANSLTVVRLPAGVSYRQLHDAMRADGFVIYAAQEHLARDFFRVSTMGRVTEADVAGFLGALERFLDSVREEHL